MKISVRRVLGFVFGTACAATILLHVYLYIYYSQTRPTQPQPDIGRTISLNNHGTVVFSNSGEERWLTWVFYGQFIFGAFSALLFFKCASEHP